MSKFRFFVAVFGIAISLATVNLTAEDDMSEAEQARYNAVLELDWKQEGRYKLNHSKSTLSIPSGYYSVFGADAKKYYLLGQCSESSDIEAVVLSEDFNSEIYFSYFDTGYISIDDWSDIDSSSLLETIKENTKESNIERRNCGRGDLTVIGWVQEPILDRHTNTVFFCTELIGEDGEILVNAKALRLGRKGFEGVTWVTDKDSYSHFGGELDVMLRAHSFNPGHRYSDFSKGDKIASYGIASLVAATVGGKIVKAGGFLLLFKKLWGFLFAGIGALLFKAKKLFRGRGNE